MSCIKIRENKNAEGINNARFTIAYSFKGNEKAIKNKSMDILTAIKGKREALIELKTSLLSIEHNKRESCAVAFLNGIKEHRIDFRSRKIPVKVQPSLMAKLFGIGEHLSESYEIIAHIPDSMWNDEKVMSLISYYGMTYYFFVDGSKAGELMNGMFNGQLLDDEKLDAVDCMIYDCIKFSQMGIFTNKWELGYLEKQLGDLL